MNNTQFKVGDKVFVIRYGRYGRRDQMTVATVETVTPTGFVRVSSYPEKKFKNGQETGLDRWDSRLALELWSQEKHDAELAYKAEQAIKAKAAEITTLLPNMNIDEMKELLVLIDKVKARTAPVQVAVD